MYKDLENTELMTSHFLEKQRIKLRLFFKSASLAHYKWPFLYNNYVAHLSVQSSNWINWQGYMLIDDAFAFVILNILLSYVKTPLKTDELMILINWRPWG